MSVMINMPRSGHFLWPARLKRLFIFSGNNMSARGGLKKVPALGSLNLMTGVLNTCPRSGTSRRVASGVTGF